MSRKISSDNDQRHREYSDKDLIVRILTTIQKRLTYGYRRVTALLNKILKSEGQPRVNHKLIYRIMKEQNLVWQAPITKPVRTHNGKVMVRKL